MNHNYAKKKLTSLLIDLNNYTTDEFRREMARIISGATGQDIPDDCHTIKAERDALALEVDEANDRNAELKAERDVLVAQVTDLEFQRVCAVTQATNMFDALRLAIAAFDKYEMSVDDYPSIEHVRMRERLYSAAFLNADKHLAEIRAEAVMGFAKYFDDSNFIFCGARKYAAIIRQGGA